MPDPIFSSSIPLDFKTTQTSQSSQDKAPGRLKQACAEMESLFIFYLLKEMRESIPKSGLFGGGKAEEMYASMLDQELAKEISSKREIGIASMLYNQFSNQREGIENKDSGNAEGESK